MEILTGWCNLVKPCSFLAWSSFLCVSVSVQESRILFLVCLVCLKKLHSGDFQFCPKKGLDLHYQFPQSFWQLCHQNNFIQSGLLQMKKRKVRYTSKLVGHSGSYKEFSARMDEFFEAKNLQMGVNV